MKVIIDAYNLFKQVLKKPQLSQNEIKYFLNKLSKYAAHKKLYLIVVFDGGSFPFISKERSGGMEILYSGYKQSADHVIKDLLNDAGGDTILVSSDRELRDLANKLKIESFSAVDFYGKMLESMNANGSAQKPPDDNRIFKVTESFSSNLDDLMVLYSRNVPQKHEDVLKARVSSDSKESKKEKKLNKILKKL